MQPPPECQAVSFGPGRTLAALEVRRSADDPPQPRYHHFHPAAEILWFRRAETSMHSRGLSLRAGTGDLVYLPSMTPHDFDVAQKETVFVLIFHDPALEGRLPPSIQARLDGPRILTADPAQAARIDSLADWLVEITSTPRRPEAEAWTAVHLLELLLALLAEEGRPVTADPSPPSARRDPLLRLERAIALIHDDPGRQLSLADAAAASHLSPAYFSRLFRARMGQTFADYVMTHRLNLAAHLVGASDIGIAEVAWRTGFGSPAHLSRRFAAQFGMSPSRYRAAARDRTPPAAAMPEGQ